MRKIAAFTIRSITPVSIGWYEPQIYDDVAMLRIPSIRGAVRWWTRALVAGVAFDNGLDEKDYAERVTNAVFGGIQNGSRSSLIALRVTVNSLQELTDQEVNYLLRNISRLALLTMGMNQGESIEFVRNAFRKNIQAVVELYSLSKEPKEFYENLAIVSTMLAFTLGGLGKGSRRGLGAFAVENITMGDKIANSTQELVDQLSQNLIRDQTDINVALGRLRALINISRRILAQQFSRRGFHNRIPEIHAITKERYFNLFIKDVRQFNIRNSLEALSFIQKIFLRNPRNMPRNLDSLSNRLQDTSGLHAARAIGSYFEGLPRLATRKNVYRLVDRRLRNCLSRNNIARDIDTGYIISEERRASPIIATFITNNIVAFSMFLSNDWPDKIEWISLHMIHSKTKRPPAPRRGIFADEFLLREFELDLRTGNLLQKRSVQCTLTGRVPMTTPKVRTIMDAYKTSCDYFFRVLRCQRVWP